MAGGRAVGLDTPGCAEPLVTAEGQPQAVAAGRAGLETVCKRRLGLSGSDTHR
jgi:hypothetical protein